METRMQLKVSYLAAIRMTARTFRKKKKKKQSGDEKKRNASGSENKNEHEHRKQNIG